ncbi:MAG: M6 family metalloprotease domain-containing protein [Muribaculaceae bacterium]|nr:M6 family metalloprotease domain-containing protein [Muribaculaceae bacterium]
MKSNLIHISLIAAAAVCGLQATAKPAKQGIFTVPTADGSELRVRLAGDEFFHQYFTEDGYPLIERGGLFYYGDYDAEGNVIDSGIKAGDVSRRGQEAVEFLSGIDMQGLEARITKRAALSERMANRFAGIHGDVNNAPAKAAGEDGPPYERGYGLFPDLRFPAYGAQKAIVILVEYTDTKFNTSYDAKDYFTRMLNEDGFSDYGGTGCAAEFFRLNSGDAFRPEFDVFGPITLANNMAYYGGNDWYGNDQRPADMVKEACDQLDDIVDFSEYDRNGDGVVDNIFIFYAGRGEASGGSANTVWPHSWNMVSAGYPNLYYDGVRIHTYGCSNEWENGRPDGVGTFIHEFSHVMGLPDLYATSYTSSFTPGAWSALDYGPYNNDGMTPPNYGAFERYALGWMKPHEIDGPLSASLASIDDNVAGVIRTAKDTEFFLVENRQQTGWDSYIPGHGMLIWHVDYNDSVWSSNKVNNTPSHQYVDIEEADGVQTESTRAGDSFPGTTNKTSFTGQTTPAMKTWAGVALDFPITDIAESDGIITFNVLGGADAPDIPMAESLPAENIGTDSFTARWNMVEGYDHILSVYYYGEDDSKIYLEGFRARNAGQTDSFAVSGLVPDCQYFYTVALSTGWHTGPASAETPVSTERLSINYYTAQADEATDVTENGFTANWLPMEDAQAWLLTVYERVPGDPFMDVCDFTDGIDNLHGWTSTSGVTYGMEAYAGEAVPSLRLNSGNTLTSPEYADMVSGLSFWHRGNGTSSGDLINVFAETSSGRVQVTSVEVQKTAGGVVTDIDEMPADTHQVIIQFVRNGDAGSLAVDDVRVAHGLEYSDCLLEGYDDLNVGSSLMYKVGGLKSSTDYVYTVRATDGELFSKVSQRINVRTGDNVGTVQMAADSAFAVTVAGNVVCADTDDEIIVADYTGSLVARGSHKVTLPRAGLYVVTVPAQGYAKKIIVR